jgi:hypothetical protein
VRCGNVNLRKPGVMTHHLQAVVAKQILQREHVSTVAEIIDGKGMAELMRVGLYSQLLPKFRNEEPQAVPAIRLLLVV